MKCLVVLATVALLQVSIGPGLASASTAEGEAHTNVGAESKAETGGFGSTISGLLSKIGIHLGGSSDTEPSAGEESGVEAESSGAAEASGSGSIAGKAKAQSEVAATSGVDGSAGLATAQGGSEVEVGGRQKTGYGY